MKKTSINLIVSTLFLLATVGSFYWLWSSSKTSISEVVSQSYTVIEIDSVKNEASALISSVEKNSDIPLKTPTDKMGRKNPFVSP